MELIREEIAAVLGHEDAAALPEGRSFDELGSEEALARHILGLLDDPPPENQLTQPDPKAVPQSPASPRPPTA